MNEKLQKYIDEIVQKNNEDQIQTNYDTHKEMMNVVAKFLWRNKCILYGGTALNLLLPNKLKFYDKYVLPDYDSFHPNARDMAIMLADHLHEKGYKYVVVKKGLLNEGTFKVYAELIPAADISQIPLKLYQSFKRHAQIVDNHYIIQNEFLRFSFHLEFAKPIGSMWRWSKLLKRFNIVNDVIKLKNDTWDYSLLRKTRTRIGDFAQGSRNPHTERFAILMNKFTKHQKHVHLGVNTYLEDVPSDWNNVMGMYQYLSIDPINTIDSLTSFLSSHSFNGDIKYYIHISIADYEHIPRVYKVTYQDLDGAEIVLCSILDVRNICISYVTDNDDNFTVIDYLMSICNYILYDPEYSPYFKRVVASMLFHLQNQIKNFNFEKHTKYRFHPECHGKEKAVIEYRKDRFNKGINKDLGGDAPDIYYPMNKRYI